MPERIDEKVALDAASAADLIIFMITNDAPQATEANWLKKILALGKPVIFIVNVKANINTPADLKMFRRDIDKKFGDGSLDDIRKQFCAFGKEYGQDWTSIPFVCASLKAAYLAEKAEFTDFKDELFRLSRFAEVEETIASIVASNGRFYKFKAYADAVSVPLLDVAERLADESVRSGTQANVLARKSAELAKRTLDFGEKTKRDVDTLIDELINELKNEASSFAEMHCENKNPGDEWQKVIAEFHIEEKLKVFLEAKSVEAKEVLEQIVEELQIEIEFASMFNRSGSHLGMDELFDWKSVVEWGSSIISLGLTVASLFIAGPIGWVALAVGIAGTLFSFFFDSMEEKRNRARRELEDKLHKHIDSSMESTRKKMHEAITKITREKMFPAVMRLYGLGEAVAFLSVMQRQSSARLFAKLRDLNKMFVTEALAYIGSSGFEYHIEDVARIPNSDIVFALTINSVIPPHTAAGLESVLGECLSNVYKFEDTNSMLRMLLGDEYRMIVQQEDKSGYGTHSKIFGRRGCHKINEKEINEFIKRARKGFTHLHSGIVRVEGLSAMPTVWRNKFRLASQLSGLVFMDGPKGVQL